nr:MAG TPA: hypothetical protein [Caudoviricetes sp.]
MLGKAAELLYCLGVGNELSPAPYFLANELDPDRQLQAGPGPFHF